MMPYESRQARTADADLLQRGKKAFRAVVPDADVILYGSRARGDAKDDSDCDLLVLVDGPADVTVHQQLISSISPLEEDGAVLTLRIHNRDRWNSGLYRAMPFHYLKPARVSKEMGDHYDLLFDNRQKGDYADFTIFDVKDVRPWLEPTKSFVPQMADLVNRETQQETC